MSARAAQFAARARVAELIAELIREHGGSYVARLIGTCKDTPGRRGGDLAQWPVADVLSLAAHTPAIHAALLDALNGTEQPIGEAVRAPGALFEAIESATGVIAESSRDLRDGRIDAIEADRLLPLVRGLRDHLADVVLPSLEAYRRG